MAAATTSMEATVGPGTDYRSKIVDPIPYYPEYAGKIAADLTSGGLIVCFAQGYAKPSELHAAIARMRDALDQLDIDIDEAMERQATVVLDGLTQDAGDHYVREAAVA